MKKTLVILPLVLAMTACSSLKYEAGMEFKAPEFGGGDQQAGRLAYGGRLSRGSRQPGRSDRRTQESGGDGLRAGAHVGGQPGVFALWAARAQPEPGTADANR